jgi:hypothetical protein
VRVDFSATFGGVLYYRGTVMHYIKNKVPFAEWEVQAILAMFCSSIDPHRSFSKYFKETRNRLLQNLCDNIKEDANKVQLAYTLACMEFQGFGSHCNPSRPTQHMRIFADILKKQPGDYIIHNDTQNKRVRYNLTQFLARARASPEWADVSTETEDNLKFLYPGGMAELKAAAKKKRRHDSRVGKGKGSGKPNESASKAPSSAAPPPAPASFIYNDVNLRTLGQCNILLHRLLEPMPGLRSHSIVNIHVSEDTLDFTNLGRELAELNGDAAEIPEEEEQAQDADGDDFDLNQIIDGADIDLMIKRRDASEDQDVDMDM